MGCGGYALACGVPGFKVQSWGFGSIINMVVQTIAKPQSPANKMSTTMITLVLVKASASSSSRPHSRVLAVLSQNI